MRQRDALHSLDMCLKLQAIHLIRHVLSRRSQFVTVALAVQSCWRRLREDSVFAIYHLSESDSNRHPAACGFAAEKSPPQGQALDALRSSDLLDRFYSWRGASRERYICSIFTLEDETIIADFVQAVVIGVARDAVGRRPVCVLSTNDFDRKNGRAIRVEGRALGVNEWHVHFGCEDAGLSDLANALLS
jgi:hypothetical protein